MYHEKRLCTHCITACKNTSTFTDFFDMIKRGHYRGKVREWAFSSRKGVILSQQALSSAYVPVVRVRYAAFEAVRIMPDAFWTIFREKEKAIFLSIGLKRSEMSLFCWRFRVRINEGCLRNRVYCVYILYAERDLQVKDAERGSPPRQWASQVTTTLCHHRRRPVSRCDYHSRYCGMDWYFYPAFHATVFRGFAV